MVNDDTVMIRTVMMRTMKTVLYHDDCNGKKDGHDHADDDDNGDDGDDDDDDDDGDDDDDITK